MTIKYYTDDDLCPFCLKVDEVGHFCLNGICHNCMEADCVCDKCYQCYEKLDDCKCTECDGCGQPFKKCECGEEV